MKKILFILFSVICLIAFDFFKSDAQADTTDAHAASIDTNITIDLLIVPNSPGFTLLGISPDNVDRPETPADFAASIANATNNLSALPKNYSMEFLPFNLLSNSLKSFSDFKAPNTIHTILQTFTISTAFATDDAVDTSISGYIKTQTGIGFRFSILNGTIDTLADTYNNTLATIRTALIQLNDEQSDIMKNFRETDTGYLKIKVQKDSLITESTKKAREYISLRKQLEPLENFRDDKDSSAKALSVKLQMDSLKDIMDDIKIKIDKFNPEQEDYIQAFKDRALKVKTDAAKQLKKTIQESKFKRTGWMLDFAGGMVLGYRNNDFQNSIVQKTGVWLNGGYEDKGGFNMLAVVRMMNTFNTISDATGKKQNQLNFDSGIKLEVDALDKKFNFSLEGITRIYSDTIVYRYTINASYQVGANQALTFALGRDFASNKQSGGNLIAALNYVKAFGTKRTIASGK